MKLRWHPLRFLYRKPGTARLNYSIACSRFHLLFCQVFICQIFTVRSTRLVDVEDPTQESWGGRFRHFDAESFPNYYIDLDQSPKACQMTIGKWRKAILMDWKYRWGRYDTKD